MVKEVKKIVEYELTKVPGFENVRFTDGSDSYLFYPEAVKFAEDRNAVLQSLREAVAFRFDADGQLGSGDYQMTRTGAGFFNDGDKFYLAVDDVSDAKENILLARAKEFSDYHAKVGYWSLPKKDKHISHFLKRAEKSGRIVEVVESPLELSVVKSGDVSEYGQNETVKALMQDVSELHASWLSKKYESGLICVLSQNDLIQNVGADNVIVWPVGLGVGYAVSAASFNYYGHARGKVV